MAYRDKPGRLTTWLHRRGIARRISSSYSGGEWHGCVVDTALPSLVLASIANRRETPRLIKPPERLDRWQWRWTFGRVA